MKDNDGYVYLGLSKCKSFDHFFVLLGYKFNHFADECPDKDRPATCGKCAGRHKTKDCNHNSLVKRINREKVFKHNPFSRECPSMVKVRAFVIRKIALDGDKND